MRRQSAPCKLLHDRRVELGWKRCLEDRIWSVGRGCQLHQHKPLSHRGGSGLKPSPPVWELKQGTCVIRVEQIDFGFGETNAIAEVARDRRTCGCNGCPIQQRMRADAVPKRPTN